MVITIIQQKIDLLFQYTSYTKNYIARLIQEQHLQHIALHSSMASP
jgi:hypothetical protein